MPVKIGIPFCLFNLGTFTLKCIFKMILSNWNCRGGKFYPLPFLGSLAGLIIKLT